MAPVTLFPSASIGAIAIAPIPSDGIWSVSAFQRQTPPPTVPAKTTWAFPGWKTTVCTAAVAGNLSASRPGVCEIAPGPCSVNVGRPVFPTSTLVTDAPASPV